MVLGALLGAASLDDRADIWWPGLLAGGLAAVLIGLAARSLLGRVKQNLNEAESGRERRRELFARETTNQIEGVAARVQRAAERAARAADPS